jgi:ppGpp synthetase/RelA/SpoT-type nucleotidyltranferase
VTPQDAISEQSWHKQQIEAYIQERPAYVAYASHLKEFLSAACREMGILASVTSRAKEVSSFAQKAARKRMRHPDPSHDFTDLCGVRVVTDTEEEAQRVCRWVERHFTLDEANSEDKRALLGATQFTYLSVHFIVQLKPEHTEAAVFATVGARKAEIQIRTGLQDVWARIAHDRIYKNPFPVPDRWQREMNRISAILEAADRDFSVILSNLEDYSTSHGALFNRQKVEAEIESLRLIAASEESPEVRRELALQTAALLKDLGRWDEVIQTLRAYTGGRDSAILKHLGYALCYKHRNAPGSPEYQEGFSAIEEAVRSSDEDAEAHAYLAWALEVAGEEERARDQYERAFFHKPRNPYYLMSYLEFQTAVQRDMGGLRLLWPVLRQAVETCHQHAEAGVEIPWAFLTKAKAHLLMAEPYAALSELARGVSRALDPASAIPPDVLTHEAKSIGRFAKGREKLEGQNWLNRLMQIALALNATATGPWPKFRADPRLALRRPVVILAGSTAHDHQYAVDRFAPLVHEALEVFSGTLIGGSTRDGVSGLAGDIAKKSEGKIHAVGYHPESGRLGTEFHEGYCVQVPTEGTGFSPFQILQMWTDLLAAGIPPASVRVIGIGGGPLSAVDYQIALALGAQVGVFAGSERAAEAILEDKFWLGTGRLVALLEDPMTVRMFATVPMQLEGERLLEAAQAAHEQYRKDKKDIMVEPSMKTWEELDPGLKESNCDQISNALEILRYAGFAVGPWTTESQTIVFTEDEVARMAPMEHGRFNVERTRQGWRPANEKDVALKLSPYLVPWSRLPDFVREWDDSAVRAWPAILCKIGLEIRRPVQLRQ